MDKYTLHLPKDIERQLRKCRAALRESIRKRLRGIVEAAATPILPRRKPAAPSGPPLRFYVFEGYRVSYQVNANTRKVVVLNLQAESS